MRKCRLQTRIIALTMLLLNGCASTYVLESEQLPDLPQTWQTEHKSEAIDDDWVGVFTNTNASSAIASFVDEALQSNQQIRADAYTAQITAQQLSIAKSDFWPSLDVDFDASRSKSSAISNSFSLDAGLSYELDIWGAISDAERQAKLAYLSAQANLTEAKLQLVASVLIAYADASSAFQRVMLFEQQVKNSRENLDIIERGYNAGLNESLDVYLARNELNSDLSTLLQNRQVLLENKRNLERLLGRYPSATIDVTETLALPVTDLKPGIPSELVKRKPALQADWFALLAQNAELAIAHKARFPSFTLSASIGPSSDSISDLLSASSAWSLLGSISAPIFEAGSLKAAEEIERLTLKAAEESYLNAVLTTLQSAENALSQEQILFERYQATNKALENADIAKQLSFEQYQAGLVSYTTVLDAQARLISAQNEQIDIQTDLIVNRIELQVALGAGANVYAKTNE